MTNPELIGIGFGAEGESLPSPHVKAAIVRPGLPRRRSGGPPATRAQVVQIGLAARALTEPHPRPRMVADGSHTVTHPDTGLTAVWLDGEAVADWAIPE